RWIDEADSDLSARCCSVFGEQIASVTLGCVMRRRQVRGEIGDDLELILELFGEPLRALGEREDPIFREVAAGDAEVRCEHIKEDQDRGGSQDESERFVA